MLFLISSTLAVFGLISGPFIYFNTITSPETKKRLYDYLSSKISFAITLPQIADGLFDAVFGKKHFSVRCVLASLIVSLLSIVTIYVIRVVLLLYFLSQPTATLSDQLQYIASELSYPFSTEARLSIAISLLGNSVLDYVGLFKTRIIIFLLRKREIRGIFRIAILILDIISSFLIFQVWFILLYIVSLTTIFGSSHPFIPAGDAFSIFAVVEIMMILRFLTWPGYPPGTAVKFLTNSNAIKIILTLTLVPFTLTSVFFYASILPSVWLWLFIAVSSSARVIGRRYHKYLTQLDFQQNPFRTIGLLIAAIVAGFWALVAGVVGLYLNGLGLLLS